jgi:hypothetical protein
MCGRISFHSVIYYIEKKHLRSLTAEEARGEELPLPAHSPCISYYAERKSNVKGPARLEGPSDLQRTQEKEKGVQL